MELLGLVCQMGLKPEMDGVEELGDAGTLQGLIKGAFGPDWWMGPALNVIGLH